MDKRELFTSKLEIRNIDKEKFTITHIINTKVLDRHGTIVLPKGVKVDNFLNNPVVLAIHNGRSLPIGKCIDLKITDKEIQATTLFNEKDPEAVKFFNAYVDGFMNAWSIGFMPLKYKRVDEENFQDLNEKYGLKIKKEDIIDAGFWGIYLIYEWELCEYSAVPVPANPEALNELVTRGFTVAEDKTDGKSICEILAERDKMEAENKKVEDTADLEKIEDRTVIKHKKYPLASEDTKWDAGVEVKKADVKDLKEMCTWYDKEDKENKGAYKLPHHKQDGYSTVWNGVKAAMGALLGARGGVKIPEGDRKGVYNHLKVHYAEFDKEVPEFKSLDEIQEEQYQRFETLEAKILDIDKLNEKIITLENSINEIKTSLDGKTTENQVKELLKSVENKIEEVKNSIKLDNVEIIRNINQKAPENTVVGGGWVKTLMNNIKK